jgi:hypothetical protein
VNDANSRNFYLDLTDADKLVFLALVSNHLTIHGRAFFIDLAGAEQSRALQGLNELQHQLSSHIAALGTGRGRYPEDVFLNGLDERASYYGLSAHFKQSFAFAVYRDFWKTEKTY